MHITLTFLDYGIIAAVFCVTMLLGIIVSKSSGKSQESFFLSNRSMPWWLLGASMVATTFSTDTPNLVTDLVRQHGVFGNWSWWCFLPTGMLTVFLYARLWRRLGTVTDLEFYEIRYSGKMATFLRGFRAFYLGFFFNVMVMASVSLAAIKIGGAMLGLSPEQSVFWGMLGTVIFTSIGGFKGVLFTDFLLFFIAMVGSVAAACCAVQQPEVGGLSGLIAHFSEHSGFSGMLSPLSWKNTDDLIAFFIVPFAVTWWSAWYPGAEPGGGGYIVQRMLAAKNENHAIGATLFFNVAHYAIRPWPWIIVALCSLLVYPDLDSIRNAVGGALPEAQCRHDVAYSLMLSKMPAGWIGLMIAGLMAAYMSTISTQLNWGASYLVNDFWKRFVRPGASGRELVWCGRAFTVFLMLASAILALNLQSALQTFQLLLSIGAGTGLLFLLRWFWWRINASCELAAMVASFVWACVFFCWHSCPLTGWQQMIVSVALTTACWLPFAWIGAGTDKKVLRKFCRELNPGGCWKKVYDEAAADGEPIEPAVPSQNIPGGIFCALCACVFVAFVIFGMGHILYRNALSASVCLAVSAVFGLLSVLCWKKFMAGKKPSVTPKPDTENTLG